MLNLVLIGTIIVSLLTGTFCGWLAKEKNYNPVAWFVLGVLFSFIALIAIAGAPKR